MHTVLDARVFGGNGSSAMDLTVTVGSADVRIAPPPESEVVEFSAFAFGRALAQVACSNI